MSNLSDYKYPEFNEDFEGMVPASGGTSVEPLTVVITEEGVGDEFGLYMNKTGSEIYSAFITGTPIFFVKNSRGSIKYFFCAGINVVLDRDGNGIDLISFLMISKDGLSSDYVKNAFEGTANTRPFSKGNQTSLS